MFFDPRIRGAGRRTHKTPGKARREMQKILTGSNVSNIDKHELGGMAGGVDSTQPDSCTPLGAPEQVAASDSSQPDLSALSYVACTTPPIESLQSGTVTSAGLALQITATEGSDSNQQPSVTSSVVHHTWITATSQEALSSGETIIPFLTLRETSSTASVPTAVESSLEATVTSTSFDPSSTTINNQPSSIISSSATIASFTAAVSRLPQVNGVSPMDKAGVIVSICVTIAIVGILVVLSVAAYTRGVGIRGVLPKIMPISGMRSSSVAQSGETVRDLESAMTTSESESHHGDEKDSCEGINLSGVQTSNLEKDDGRWLEEWRRDKGRMMSQPPALRFNPELPLPPINLLESAWRNT